MQSVVADAVLDVVKFPAWWYSKGFVRAAATARDLVMGYERTLGVRVWARNLLVPMFGRYDWQSRIISFFMRAANVFFRGLVWGLFALLVLAGLGVYVVLPIVAAIMALYHAGDVIV